MAQGASRRKAFGYVRGGVTLERLKSHLAILAGYGLRQKLEIMASVARYYISRSVLRRKYLVRRIHGSKMYLDVQRRGVSRALAFFGTREELQTKVLKWELKNGMVMLDLGANIGYYTLMAASIVGARGKVYAVEPFPENLELLARNVEANGLGGTVELHQLAISDESGTAELFMGKASNLHSLLRLEPGQASIMVPTMTLDQFLAGKAPIEFLRMDIEGAECLVFDGMEGTLGQERPPKMLFEIHPIGDIDPDPRFTPRLEKLIAHGYIPKYVISSANPVSLGCFAELGYEPQEIAISGNGLFKDVRVQDLIKVAARRPKITRAILLVHHLDRR